MREDTRTSYETADAVHRKVAGFRHHCGSRRKTQKNKPGVHRPLSEKNKESLRLKGKSLTKPLDSLKSRIPIRTFYTNGERKKTDFW